MRPLLPLLLVLVGVTPAFSQEEEAVRVFNAVQSSVVGLEGVAGSGTGIILDSAGHILTNAHVVALPLGFKCLVDVKRAGKNETLTFGKVKVLGVHPTLDLALVKIDPAEHGVKLPPAKILKQKAQTGQRVYAIGNPGAAKGVNLSKTITEGLLSGVDRVLDGSPYYQFSAAINPGNSGGPLCDRLGNVIGLVTLKLTDLDGVGFAIPLQDLKRDEFKPLLARTGDPAKAAEYLQVSTALIRDINTLNRAGQGDSLKAQFLRVMALQLLQEALLQDPSDPTTYCSIGDLLTDFKEFDAAEAHYVRAIEIAPWGRDGMIYRSFGMHYIARKRPEDAMIVWREGVAKHPMAARQMWEDLAISYRNSSDFVQAAVCAATAICLGNDHTRIDTCTNILHVCKASKVGERASERVATLGDDGGQWQLRRNIHLAANRMVITKEFADLLKSKGAVLEDDAKNRPAPSNDVWLTTVAKDLLAGVDPQSVSVGGKWTVSSGQWNSPAAGRTGIALAPVMPEEFDLYVEVERLSGAGEFVVGFPYQKQMAMYICDFGGAKSGLSGVRDGLYDKPLLTIDDPVSLVVKVRKSSLNVQANGRDVLIRKTAGSVPAPASSWQIPPNATVFVGANSTKFRVHGLWTWVPQVYAPMPLPALAKVSSSPSAFGTLPGGFSQPATDPSGTEVGSTPRPSILDRIPRPAAEPEIVPPFGSSAPAAEVAGVREILRIDNPGWSVNALAFSPDGKYLAAGKSGQTLIVYEAASGRKVAEVTDLDDLGDIKCVAFTPQGDKLLAGGYKGKIAIWEFAPGRLKPAKPYLGHSQEVRGLTVSADGKFVLSGGRDKRLRYWELGTARDVHTFELKEDLLDVAFSADGNIAYATDRKSTYHFDLASGDLKSAFPHQHSYHSVAALSKDGTMVAGANGYKLELNSSSSPTVVDTRESIWDAAFSPDGRFIFAGGRGKVLVVDLKSQQALGALPVGSYYVQTIAVSPDGRFMAAVPGSAGQAIQIFELPK